jgi:hypothetical protein
VTYQYAKSYSNKTDFSNAIILNMINPLSMAPINKNYSHLPDKNTANTIEKDQNGAVVHNFTSSVERQFTYNSYGFVATSSDVTLPDQKTTFIYNK